VPKPSAGAQYVTGGAYGVAFFHILPYLEQSNVYNASNTTQYYYYSTGGDGYTYKTTFPPYNSTTTDTGPGTPTVYLYHYDYTQAPYNYGYIYDFTETLSNYPQYTYVPSGIRAYWASACTAEVPVFRAPNDPTIYGGSNSTQVSYVVNGTLFDLNLTLLGITDGTSNTIAYAEGYSSCGSRYGQYNQTYPGYSYSYSYTYTYTNGTKQGPYNYTYGYQPVPVIRSVAGSSFQDSPQTGSCDGTLAQSFSSGVVQVALADASVRGVTADVTTKSWGAAMTPNSGDIVGGDF
jgi:hypothetical protein